MRWFRLIALTAAVTAASAASAFAGAVMHINDGTAYLFSNEVHPISSPSVNVLENGSGQPTLVNPLLLVIGVPNVQTPTSYTAPGLTLSVGSADLGGAGTDPSTNTTFGGTYYGGSGAAKNNGGVFNAGEVYSFIGLTGGDNSNSFLNWSAADSAVNGLTVNEFGIFVYELTGTGMTGGKTITATFNGSIPVGTFVVAYGQDGSGKAFSTPFTEAGVSTGVHPFDAPTPEPASVILLGTGLSALYARQRRRRGRSA